MFDGITNKGSEYLAKCQATGEGIKIVKIKIGDGRILDEEDPTTFIDIKSIKKEAKISEKTQIDNALRLVIEFNNEEVEIGYFPREIGVYAQDGENEILYWYINEGEETSWMPPSEKTPVNFKYGLNIIATNNETTIINWTGRDLWINKETFEIEMKKKQNINEPTLETDEKNIPGAINEIYNEKFDKTGGTIDGNVVVIGEFVGNNNITAYSDEIVKENIIELTPEVLKKLSKIKFYNYTMINQPGKLRVGVMASELQELFPELVVEVDGIKTVDYTGLNTYFSYAIQQILVGGINGK